ncbi:protein kinase [Desulfobulbus sp. AH-315-M07]|nr:protein kinase [Desulfobulbus sp. AH-315-M07]
MVADVGQVIHGRYRLVRLIGDGGMGCVFEATHERLGSRVALKFLHPHLARRAGFKERFLREAQISAQIKSPHVVGATDVDVTEDGEAFMVMELITGGTLQEHYEALRTHKRWLSRDDAIDFILQICDGVEAAHELGVVHRDIKPDNVMLDEHATGVPLLRIMDFGVAKLRATEKGLTQPGIAMGTPEYMAPEQAISASEVDASADVFSVGVMFYEMLANRRPVEGGNMLAIADAYRKGRIIRLEDALPSIEPGLADVVHQAIAGAPPDRFATVVAFRAALLAELPEQIPHPSTASPRSIPSSKTVAEAPSIVIETRPEAPAADGGADRLTEPDSPADPTANTEFDDGQRHRAASGPPSGGRAEGTVETTAEGTQLSDAPPLKDPPNTTAPLTDGLLADSPPRATKPRYWRAVLAALLIATLSLVGVHWAQPFDAIPPIQTRQTLSTALVSDWIDLPMPSVAPPPPPPPPPALAPRAIDGEFGGRRVRMEYSRERSSDGDVDIVVTVTERGNTTLERVQKMRAQFIYYYGHSVTSAERSYEEATRHARLATVLALDGKYHVSIVVDLSSGPFAFTCDACLGQDPKKCKMMSRSCKSPAPAGHHHD